MEAEMLTILAPAKINLALEVLEKRQDGFHEIRSVIQTISLGDSLTFEAGRDIEFKSASPGWIAEESLISSAASLVRQATGYSGGVTIEIKKRIPLMSGLGGDSSDAAAVLRGLNQLWELDLSRDQLIGLAWQLGSDVAFFLDGGTALLEGRGELVTPLPPLPRSWVVLAIPPVPRLAGKTKQLYASLKTGHLTDGRITERLSTKLREGKEFTPSLLFNTFENLAFTRRSVIEVCRSHIRKMGAKNVHLAGSGPTLFTLLNDKHEAEDLFERLQNQKIESYLAETITAQDYIN